MKLLFIYSFIWILYKNIFFFTIVKIISLSIYLDYNKGIYYGGIFLIKKLIMNADDFGMTQGNSIGILLAHAEGILTSTTCMMNMPYAEWALKEAKKYPELGVGIHFVLTVGRPLVGRKQKIFYR